MSFRRPGPARWLVTFLARPRKVTQRRPPRCRAPYSRGVPVLPDSTRAAAEPDMAGHTQRALPWDSNSPRRKPPCRVELHGAVTRENAKSQICFKHFSGNWLLLRTSSPALHSLLFCVETAYEEVDWRRMLYCERTRFEIAGRVRWILG